MADESKAAASGGVKFSVEGLCSAPYTSFNDDGSLDLDGGVKSVVGQLAKTGVKYAFVAGTTGESLKMTVDERKRLLERWIEVVAETGAEMTIIAHVGCESMRDTLELTRHAVECGIPAIGVMPSPFFKPPTIGCLVDWVEEVAKAAPSTAVYYYHLKVMTGVNFPMHKVLEACDKRGISNLVGMKFSDADIWEFSCCQRVAGGKYDMLYGKDEQLLGAMAMGCRGAVGSTYNYMAPEIHRMIAAFKAGDLEAARKCQAHSGDLVKLLHNGSRYGEGVNIQKAIMMLKGVRVGPPRKPHRPIAEEGLALLKADLEAIGFFEWSD